VGSPAGMVRLPFFFPFLRYSIFAAKILKKEIHIQNSGPFF
jgi:hypothetical protein